GGARTGPSAADPGAERALIGRQANAVGRSVAGSPTVWPLRDHRPVSGGDPGRDVGRVPGRDPGRDVEAHRPPVIVFLQTAESYRRVTWWLLLSWCLKRGIAGRPPAS